MTAASVPVPTFGQISTLDADTIAARRMPKTIVVRPDLAATQPPRRIQVEPFKAVKPEGQGGRN